MIDLANANEDGWWNVEFAQGLLADRGLFRDQCLVDGRWIGRPSIEVRNPADGELIARVPALDRADTVTAIEAADRALPAWRALTAAERAAILRRWFELIIVARDDLARLLTAEQGKPLSEANGEIRYAAAYVEWFAEEAKRLYGEVIPGHAAGMRTIVLRQPVGVCAAITPWNFPAAMITRKVGPALAAGCTIVLKPASQTPLSALALGELALRAGVPAGVFNIITGPAAVIGDELVRHPLVRKVSFTGSTEIGRTIMAGAAPTLKRLSLELGGNAPFIVFEDADIPAAVEGGLAAKFRNAGQTCVCVNRFIVHHSVMQVFAQDLARAVQRLVIGPGHLANVNLGPLIDQNAVDKVQEHIDDALAKGAQLLTGGRRHALGGLFYEPTVLVGCTSDMMIAREETFGPVAAIFGFSDEAEAIRLANATDFGLASYLYSRDFSRIWRVAEALECGMVGVNTGLISTETAPFGGTKQSGFGREGSRHGLSEYVDIKYLALRIDQ